MWTKSEIIVLDVLFHLDCALFFPVGRSAYISYVYITHVYPTCARIYSYCFQCCAKYEIVCDKISLEPSNVQDQHCKTILRIFTWLYICVH